jgi:hypothetical protein
MGNTDFLGRKPRPGRGRQADPARPRETGRDPLAADYERGPYVDQVVAPFPPGLLALLERRTGKVPDLGLLAEYERIRAFTGYQGIEPDPRLAARASLVDPLERRATAPTVEAPIPARAGLRAPAARIPLSGAQAPDPEDLGGD